MFGPSSHLPKQSVDVATSSPASSRRVLSVPGEERREQDLPVQTERGEREKDTDDR